MFTKSSVNGCKFIELPKIHSRTGNITFVEGNRDVQFRIKRIYFLYDIPNGAERGGHAHKDLYQLIIAATGSFEVLLDDGKFKKSFNLYQPNKGLLVVPGIWRELVNFSSGSICLVLASELYTEDDYIRKYEDFIKLKR